MRTGGGNTPRIGANSAMCFFAACALSCLISCTGQEGSWRTYDEPAADGSLIFDGEAAPLEECYCDEQTYDALRVTGEATITAEVKWHEEAQLVLSGCVNAAGPPQSAGQAVSIDLSLRGPNAEVTELIQVDPNAGWWQQTFDLGLEGGSGELTLQTHVQPGNELFLRDVFTRSRITTPVADDAPPQVLLISIDTLRHDSFDGRGTGPSTANLDRFMAEAEVWDRHYAGASWTKPSHATLLTGVPPWVHDARGPEEQIRPSILTIAERFRSQGFATAGVVFDCKWLDPKWGFDRGFADYRVEPWRIDRQVRYVQNWVYDHRSSPFFLFLHAFEMHSDFIELPYEAPGVSARSLERLFAVKDYGCRNDRCASTFLQGINLGLVPVEPYDPLILRYSYDSGINHVSRALGDLFDSLRNSGIWDNLLVVLTSDHGEAFLEHGMVSHKTLHEEVIRVPLAIKWPNQIRAGTRNPVPSASVDIAPTLLEAAGVQADGLPGTHLARRNPDQAMYAGSYSKTIVLGMHKGIFGGKDKLCEVYDLGIDPAETDNIAARRPDLTRELSEQLHHRVLADREAHQITSADHPQEAPALTDAEKERLKALGYLE